MSYTGDFLGAMKKRGLTIQPAASLTEKKNAENNATTAQVKTDTTAENASAQDTTGTQSTGTNQYTQDFFAALDKANNRTIAERAEKKTQRLLQRQTGALKNSWSDSGFEGILRSAVGSIGTGGYYSRPTMNASVSSLNSKITELESGLTDKRNTLESVQPKLEQLQAEVVAAKGALTQAKSLYDSDPTEENAQSYNQSVSKYNQACNTYSFLFGKYKDAYDGYKGYENQLVDALAVSNVYSKAHDNWRSTIRDEDTINRDIAAVSQRLEENPDSEDLKNRKELLDEELTWSKYYEYADVTGAEDYAEKSAYIPQEQKQRRFWDIVLDNYADDASGWEDPLYEAINGNKEAIGYLESQGSTYYGSAGGGLGELFGGVTEGKSEAKQMTEDEIGIFNYLYATKGKEAAHEYYEYLQSDLNYRQRAEDETYWAKYAKDNPVAASIYSLAVSPVKGLSYLGQTADYLVNGKIDQNAAYNKFASTPDTIRAGVSGDIEEKLEKVTNIKAPGKVLSMLYQTGMSTLDSLVNTALSGGMSGGGALSSATGLALMATGAAASGTIDAKDRGLTDGQSFALGTIAGLAEAITEKFSVETLLDPDLFKDGAKKYILKNMAAEGSEEAASDLINLTADLLISGNEAELMQEIQEYKNEGLSTGKAAFLAVGGQFLEMLADFAGGALSGGVISGGSVAINNAIGKKQSAAVQNAIAYGLRSDPESEAYKVSSEIRNRLEQGENLNEQDITGLEAIVSDPQTYIGVGLQCDPESIAYQTAELVQGDIQAGKAVTAKEINLLKRAITLYDQQQARQQLEATETADDTNVSENAPLADEVAGKTEQQILNLQAVQQTAEADIGENTNTTNGQDLNLEGNQYAAKAELRSNATDEGERGNLLSDGGRQRNDGASAGKQTGIVGSRTGETTARNPAGANAARASIQRASIGKNLRLEKISSKQLGLKSGTDIVRNQVLPEESWDAGMRQTAEQVYQETGKRVTYVLGSMQIQTASGKITNVKGVTTADGIVVQANHTHYTAEQIAEHEAFHGMRDVYGQMLTDGIVEQIKEEFSEEEFNEVLDRYIDALAGLYDFKGGNADKFEEISNKIIEEMLADARAGMNMWNAGATKFTETVNRYLDENSLSRKPEQENGVRQTAGPPESGNVTGERYSFAGERAETADLEALEDAKKMLDEGISEETIRQQTGWHRGMDGKWRWEIDDSRAQYRPDGDANLLGEPAYQRLQELTQKWADSDGELSMGETMEMEKLQEEYSDRVWEEKYQLSDFIRHEALFEAYPSLRHASVTFDQLPAGVNGTYDRKTNTITLSNTLVGSPEKTLLHEIQHMIQKKEGFAKGSNTKYWNEKLEDGENVDSIGTRNAKRELKDFEADPENTDAMLMIEQLNKAGQSENVDTYDELWQQAEMMGLDEKINRYYDLQSAADAAQSRANNMTPSELYRNTAGEIEARDTAQRWQMDAEQRKNTPPERGDGDTVFAGMADHFADEERYDYTKPFAEQVDDWMEGKLPKIDTLMVGKTPEVLQRIGFNALPVTINQKHVDYAINGTKNADHHLGAAMLKQLPMALQNPVAVFASETKSDTSVVALLSFTKHGRNVVAPIRIDGYGHQNSVQFDSNAVTSIYARKNATRLLSNAIQQYYNGKNTLFYLDTKETAALYSVLRVTMPKLPSTNNGFIASITDAGSPVKTRFSNVTETQQFKRWFGDWQNHPGTASKVVNEDGTPKVVYHGTNQSFHAFDQKLGAYWFSEYQDYAEAMVEERGGGEVKSAYLNIRNPLFTKLDPGQFSDPNFEAPILRKAKAEGYDGVIIENSSNNPLVRDTFYVAFSPEQIKSATDNVGTFDGNNPDIRYSVDENTVEMPETQTEMNTKTAQDQRIDRLLNQYRQAKAAGNKELADKRYRQLKRAIAEENKAEKSNTQKKKTKPAAESKAIIAKADFQKQMTGLFSIPDGQKEELNGILGHFFDRVMEQGSVDQQNWDALLNQLYESGVVTMPADELYAEGRGYMVGGRVYINDSLVAELGDDWHDLRSRAFAAGIYLTRHQEINGKNVAGLDTWNQDLAQTVPGLFDENETDQRTILERIIQVAEEGKDEKVSLPEYTARLAQTEHQSEAEFRDNIERQAHWIVFTAAEKANLEIKLRDRTGIKLAQEREKRLEAAQNAKNRKEVQELRQKTLKGLQWLRKNENKLPAELLENEVFKIKDTVNTMTMCVANELQYSKKYGATYGDLAQMYEYAKENDPNFLPSKDLQGIFDKVRLISVEELTVDELMTLNNAIIALQTEWQNRNKVLNDRNNMLFNELYHDARKEIQMAPGGYKGNNLDKLLNLDQLSAMNVLQRMVGWNPNSSYFGLAKQLEIGERDMRAYKVESQKMLKQFLEDNADWVKVSDGRGEKAVWYEVEIPELKYLKIGEKPVFGGSVTVAMTPAQKVHLYLESLGYDNLNHIASGGRTFVDKKLYSEGKLEEAFAQGTTVRMAPETVKALVSDLTEQEMELANILKQYYNVFAPEKINKISNVLCGFDKAKGGYYAPIYSNDNYVKSTIGENDAKAENVGNLKERKHGTNATYNISAFEAFDRNVEQIARYVGMAIPTRNWETYLNWMGEGTSTNEVITKKWGDETVKYIKKLITDLNAGGAIEKNVVTGFFGKLKNNYISAVFGANPSIVLKQLGSALMGYSYLGWDNFKLGSLRGIDTELMQKYTQDLEWRGLGYSMPETKALVDNPGWVQDNKVANFTLGGGAITAMDYTAAKWLWPGAVQKAETMYPELELGTTEQQQNGESPLLKKAAEIFEDAVARTQSTSDVTHQSSLRKSKNPLAQAFTIFRSDSAQTYNLLRQKIGEAQYFARTGADEKTVKTARRAVGAVAVAALGGFAWAEIIDFLMNLWKYRGKHYRDDDGELTAGSVTEEMLSGMFGDIAGIVTGGEEAYDVLGAFFTGESLSDVEIMGAEQFNDCMSELVSSGKVMKDFVAGATNVISKGGDLGKYIQRHGNDILGSIKEIAVTGATYFKGFPAENLEKFMLGTVSWISPELKTAYEDLLETPDKRDLSGLTGGALETRVRDILANRKASDSEETAQALAELYEAGYKTAVPSDTPESIKVNGEEQALGTYQQQTYDMVWGDVVKGTLDQLVSSEAFATADEKTQAKMLNNLYSYAKETAVAELFDDYEITGTDATIAELKKAGMELADCISWVSSTSGMKQTEKMEELREWDISDEAKTAVLGSILGTDMETDAGNPTQYAKMLNSLSKGLTVDEYLDMRLSGGDTSDYLELVESGMDGDEALELVNRMEELESQNEGVDVDSLTKWRVSVDFSDDVENQLIALSMVMTDAQMLSVEVANDFGVEPDLFVKFHEVRSEYDTDGNGKYTQSEVTAVIDSEFSGLSQDQKAVLWQVMCSSTKTSKNNPYSQSVGQEVLDAKAAKKEEG